MSALRRAARLAAGLLAIAPAWADTTRPAPIDRNGTLILIRSTLLALDQANRTGNYTVLRDLGSPGFQANSAARLGEIFAAQRVQKLDLSGVAVLEPQLSLLPQIEPDGMMHLAGFFPSVPTQVNFELMFAPVESRWRVFGLSVSLGSAVPAAPAPPQAGAPKPAQAPPPGATSKPAPKTVPRPTPKTPPKPVPAPPASEPGTQSPAAPPP